jgi:hypothetical protein
VADQGDFPEEATGETRGYDEATVCLASELKSRDLKVDLVFCFVVVVVFCC